MRNFLPPDTVNPISGCTRAQEIEIQKGIGGQLPFDTYEDLVWRGIVPYPHKNRKPDDRTGK